MSKAWRPARVERERDAAVRVIEPKRETEFEIQAVIWSGLRKLGLNARGEVKCAFNGRAQVRFDIAIFEHGELVGLIECKKAGKQLGTDWTLTRQGSRYAQFNVPVRLVRGIVEGYELLADADAGFLWKRNVMT